MENLIVLEYKEKKGHWHYNMVRNGKADTEPDTFDWETIALTDEYKARIFTSMMDCKLHRREAVNKPPYTAEYIKKEWKLFCYVYNSILKNNIHMLISPKTLEQNFNDVHALARLGNGHFSDVKEEMGLSWAWEYDPFDYVDANF